MPGAQYAGVTLLNRDGVTTSARTDELVDRVDALQYGTRQGPCLDAASEGRTVRADDLRAETRWPLFSSAAVRLGVTSMMSFAMPAHGKTLGSLNLYASQASAFPAASEQIGATLAVHVAGVMSAARMEASLRVALDSRDVIGQAKGILMERYKISADEAFDLLIATSQRKNVRLRDVASHLATAGELLATPKG